MTKRERLELMLKILKLQLQVLLLKKKLTIPSLKKPKHIVLHHGAGQLGFMDVNEYHRRKWGFKSSLGYYIGYHYFIEKNGKVYQGRRDTERAAHTVEKARPGYWNNNSIGICLQGNFQNETPTDEQLLSLTRLISRKRAQYNIPISEIYGHRDISPTLCPGKYLYKWLQDYQRSKTNQ